jgi:hypothetical protein
LKLGHAMLARPALTSQHSPASIYADMAAGVTDSTQALELLEKAVAAAKERNESPAYYLIRMFPLRIIRGEQEEFNHLMARLRPHLEEPGVSESLYSILARFGLIQPTGRPRYAAPEAERLDLTASVAAAAPSGAVWTPDGPATPSPATGAAEKKSSLWLPGMD